MAEAESPKETNFIEQIRTAYGYDVYTESALARLAAIYESSARIEQITRTSSPHKEPKGWRDQFMCMISTRRQKQLHRRDWRSRSKDKERSSHVKGCGSKVASGESISANKIPIPALHFGNSCSIIPVPRLKSLSTIKEHLSAANRRSSRVAKEKIKQMKLRGSKRSSPKKKRERMMTYHAFQSDPALPLLSPFLAAQNEINPTCRPSVLERLVLKGAYAKGTSCCHRCCDQTHQQKTWASKILTTKLPMQMKMLVEDRRET